MRALLAPDLRARLIAACRSAQPSEACGLWNGVYARGLWRIEQVFESPNVALGSGRDGGLRFRVDAVVQLRAEREATSRAQRVLGSWHSHPGGGRRPSKLDLKFAEAGQLLGIVAFSRTDGPSLQVWTLRDSELVEVALGEP